MKITKEYARGYHDGNWFGGTETLDAVKAELDNKLRAGAVDDYARGYRDAIEANIANWATYHRDAR